MEKVIYNYLNTMDGYIDLKNAVTRANYFALNDVKDDSYYYFVCYNPDVCGFIVRQSKFPDYYNENEIAICSFEKYGDLSFLDLESDSIIGTEFLAEEPGWLPLRTFYKCLLADMESKGWDKL